MSIDEQGALRALEDYRAGRTRKLSDYLEELRRCRTDGPRTFEQYTDEVQQRRDWMNLGEVSLRERFDAEPF